MRPGLIRARRRESVPRHFPFGDRALGWRGSAAHGRNGARERLSEWENCMSSADIGLIGLAVMGSNLALNIAENGYMVAVHNRTASRIDDFVAVAKEQGLDGKVIPKADLADFIQTVKRPRSIIIMVKAGKPVDDMIEQLLP